MNDDDLASVPLQTGGAAKGNRIEARREAQAAPRQIGQDPRNGPCFPLMALG